MCANGVSAELEQVATAVEQLEQSGALRQCDLMCFLYDGHSKESMAYAEQFFTEVSLTSCTAAHELPSQC